MANDATKVIVGSPKVGGYAFTAPLGTTIPADATATLAGPLAAGGLGYITEDGVTRSVDVSTEDVRDWNGDVIRTLVTETTVEFTFTLAELNTNALEAIYGDEAITSAADSVTIAFKGDVLPHRVWDFELRDGDNAGRIVIADGQVSNPGGGEITLAKDAPIQHEVTVRCFRAADGTYFRHYQGVPGVTVEAPDA